MPCYQPTNVNAQRGDGVFERSIRALQLLNRLGYAQQPAGGKKGRFSFGISIRASSKASVFCWVTIVSDARPEPAVPVGERWWRLADSMMTGRDELLLIRV